MKKFKHTILTVLITIILNGMWCGPTKTVYKSMILLVKAESGLDISYLSVTILKETDGKKELYPRDPSTKTPWVVNVSGWDLTKQPYKISVIPSERMNGVVTAIVFGLDATKKPIARAAQMVNLDRNEGVLIFLKGINLQCDVDQDGFDNCNILGCCGSDDDFVKQYQLKDCNDSEPRANPLIYEDGCINCGDGVDNDCDGEDVKCKDKDGDGARDCLPPWCEEESKGSAECLEDAKNVDCDPNDKTVFVGAPELCDGKDNDCDGDTDEGLNIGMDCGVGACGGGKIECFEGKAVCSTEKNKTDEICDNQVDDDCDGETDEGCVVVQGDYDGDGVENWEEDKLCNNPMAKYHSEIFPEKEGGKKHIILPQYKDVEPCCPYDLYRKDGCKMYDWNCDGKITACDENDKDGDGLKGGVQDCDDNEKTVNKLGVEKCGDGIDQDCTGGDLSCSGIVDNDKDGYMASQDCDDDDSSVHPNAEERCNGKDDDCNGYVDDGNPVEGKDLCVGHVDEGECIRGVTACIHKEGEEPKIECVDYKDKEDEICDGKDNDCNGATDEIFYVDEKNGKPCIKSAVEKCSDMPKVGELCKGLGECGVGSVECFDEKKAGCSVNPGGSEYKGVAETCDGLDNNCDGETDEGLTDPWKSDCLKVGVCDEFHGDIVAKCMMGKWFCTYDKVPFYENPEKSCDEKDNDCDGQTDEELIYDDLGKIKYKGDECGVGLCEGGKVICDNEKKIPICSTIGKAVTEKCNGIDDDCDGKTDEGYSYKGMPVWKDEMDTSKGKNPCMGVGECGAGEVECLPDGSGTTCSTNPNGSKHNDKPEICDGKDNDCDGEVDEGLTDPFMSDCVNVGVCQEHHGDIKVTCYKGVWTCDYTGVSGYEADLGADPKVNPGPEKSCDDKDNDCDGMTDEDFLYTEFDGTKKGKGIPCGTGACAGGKVVCAPDKKGVTCSSLDKASNEICDYVDNDCDGKTDEGHTYNGKAVGEACIGIGECGQGYVECHSLLFVAVCSTNPDGSQHQDKAEVCDNKDNDCDGETDENLTDVLMSDCNKKGVCGDGYNKIKAVCSKGQWTCDYTGVLDWETPQEKSCDGKDNDCDGDTDEDFTYYDSIDGKTKKKGDKCGTGACGQGIVTCKDDKSGLYCKMPSQGSPEVCNGIDDDCDGQTDESAEADPTCNDNKECTTDKCVSGTCKNTVNAGYCLIGGVCYSNNAVNPSEQQCQYCDASKNQTQWTFRVEGTTCNADNNGCTVGDACKQGKCTAGVQADCSSQDDQCNKGKCESTGAGTYKCVKDPVPKNGQACNDGQPCTHSDKCSNGTCVGTPYSCDDGKSCTDDICQGDGTCKNPIQSGYCVINNQCVTAGSVDPTNQCKECIPSVSQTQYSNKDGKSCDDKDACTTGEKCSGGICGGGSPMVCDDNNVCTDDTCDKTTGCKYTPNTKACDDGEACTKDDKCVNGFCKGTIYYCDDGKSCTDDICQGDGTCKYTIKAGYCLIAGVCYANGATNPDNVCLKCDTTKTNTGWSINQGVACNDNNLCTKDDKCDANGVCKGVSYTCNDGIGCTDDKCNGDGTCSYPVQSGKCLINKICYDTADQNPVDSCQYCDPTKNQTGWSVKKDGSLCDDGKFCTTNDVCKSGVCSYSGKTTDIISGYCYIVTEGECVSEGTLKPDNDCYACQTASSKTAWTQRPNNSPCDDKDACTTGEKCSAGKCGGGSSIVCNDNNVCTDDTCDKTTGCVYTPNTKTCNDNNPCTKDDKCNNGVCNGTPYSCDDGKECTTDECDGKGGCKYTTNTGYCHIDGVCYKNGDINPSNDCQKCDDKKPNQWTNLPDGTACTGDIAPCTDDICLSGKCEHPIKQGNCLIFIFEGQKCFDDGQINILNECQICDSSKNQTDWTNLPDGTPCTDDGFACTGDKCLSGKCEHPITLGQCLISGGCYNNGQLNPSNDCQKCDPSKSQTDWTNLTDGTSCKDDGVACTDDKCLSGKCEHPIKPNTCFILNTCYNNGEPNPSNTCQVCYASKSQTNWTDQNQGAPCDDYNPCTYNDKCDASSPPQCKGIAYTCPINQCDSNECKGDGTCVPKPDETSCNDNNLCTKDDKCNNGVCNGTPYSCTQPNPDCKGDGTCYCKAANQTCSNGACCTSDGCIICAQDQTCCPDGCKVSCSG